MNIGYSYILIVLNDKSVKERLLKNKIKGKDNTANEIKLLLALAI